MLNQMELAKDLIAGYNQVTVCLSDLPHLLEAADKIGV